MTDKKRKRRRRPDSAASARSGGARPAPRRSGGPSRQRPNAPVPRRTPAAAQLLAGVTQPPLALTVSRGLTTVGASPSILASGFLVVFVLWLGSTVLGIGSVPTVMAWYLALPPIHSVLADIRFLSAAGIGSGVDGVMAGVVLVGLRAVVVCFWIGAIVTLLQSGAEGFAVRQGVGAIRSRFLVMLGIQAGYFVLALFGYVANAVAGPSLGPLLLIAVLLFGLYFLVFAPIVAVCEGVGPRDAVKVSARAARIPGPRHAVLVSLYLLVAIFLPLALPGGRLLMATPTIPAWISVLFASYLHLAALAAFSYRWLAVRTAVLESLDMDAGERARGGRSDAAEAPRGSGALRGGAG